MNWSQMKKMLIIAFIVLDVILEIIFIKREENLYTISGQDQQQIVQTLNNNNIMINAVLGEKKILTNVKYNILGNYYPMSKLKVKSSILDVGKISRDIFGDSVKIDLSLKEDGITKYIKDDQYIIADNTGKVQYFNENGIYPPEKFSSEEVEKVGIKFAKQFTNKKISLKHRRIEIEEDYFILEYYDDYKGEILFSSYISMKISQKGIIEAKEVRYEPIKFVEGKRYIFSPDEILYHFMEYIKREKGDDLVRITSIDRGYDIVMESSFEEDFDVVLPYYRIFIGGNETIYYINAYTNEIVKK